MQSKKPLRSSHFSLSGAPLSSSHGREHRKLLMAVPKRLLKKASSRNAVKRVCREAWRAKLSVLLEPRLELSTVNRGTEQVVAGALIKLHSLPVFESQADLKRLIRKDLDKLFSRWPLFIPYADGSVQAMPQK